jgi:hypothetical protein
VSHDDFAVDPIPGLPENLPPGERLLWQGKPRWQAVAVRVMHVRKVAIYFALLITWGVVEARLGGAGWLQSFARSAPLLLVLAAAGVGVLTLLAWLVQRTTIYSITSARVVIRLGIALPMTINLPFSAIESASLRTCGDGTGDLPLSLIPAQKLGYILLWPHVRPWRLARVEPMLRAVADPAHVAQLLSQALQASLSPGNATAPEAAAASGAMFAAARDSQGAQARVAESLSHRDSLLTA